MLSPSGFRTIGLARAVGRASTDALLPGKERNTTQYGVVLPRVLTGQDFSMVVMPV